MDEEVANIGNQVSLGNMDSEFCCLDRNFDVNDFQTVDYAG